MIDRLTSIGIEKGKPFDPDPKTREVLEAAAREARAWLDARYETTFFPPPYYAGGHWTVPASPAVLEGLRTMFANPDSYPVDDRGVTYSYAYFSPKRPGAGQFYLMTIKDKAGRSFDGRSTYRLTVPANAPVTLYWSATAYDRVTHALIRDQQWSSRSSLTRGFRRTPTARWTSTLVPSRPPARRRTGSPPAPTVGSKSCSACMARRSRCSTRRGGCRTSSRCRVRDEM
jgi:hypothetical protein